MKPRILNILIQSKNHAKNKEGDDNDQTQEGDDNDFNHYLVSFWLMGLIGFVPAANLQNRRLKPGLQCFQRRLIAD